MAEHNNSDYVRFINVQKSYDGETLVVKNLNLDIARGEFVTMLGPSGPPDSCAGRRVPNAPMRTMSSAFFTRDSISDLDCLRTSSGNARFSKMVMCGNSA